MGLAQARPNNAYYHTTSQLCVHALCMHALCMHALCMHALCMHTLCMHTMHGIGIDNRSIVWELADGDGFQCSSSSACDDDYDDEPLLKKLRVLVCMPPECASEHLKLPKFPRGACPQTPLE